MLGDDCDEEVEVWDAVGGTIVIRGRCGGLGT